MHQAGTGTRSLRTLVVSLLLSLIAIPDGLAGEWETLRESYDAALKAQARRIAEIEARERGAPADQEKRAEKITRARITDSEGFTKGGGKARSLVEAARRAADDARALSDLSREQGEYLAGATSEWRGEGTERRKLRESTAILQKNLDRANASLTRLIEIAETTTMQVPDSGVPAKIAQMEAEAKARASWQVEQAARERERLQREREAAGRERGVR